MSDFRQALAAAQQPALFLDFDGTLVPIRMRPTLARLSPARRVFLRRLAASYPTAIVSGRPLGELEGLIGVPGPALVGNHGLEIRTSAGTWVHAAAARGRRRLEQALGRITPGLRAIPRAFIEDKGLTASLHFRLSPRGAEARVRRLADESLAGLEPWLELRPGKKVIEIRPRVGWDKGAAVRRLLAGLRPGTTPVYIGDDRTDEDAFRALAGIGLTARVGGRGPTAAGYRLAGVEDVWTALKGLRRTRCAADSTGGRRPGLE